MEGQYPASDRVEGTAPPLTDPSADSLTLHFLPVVFSCGGPSVGFSLLQTLH